MRLSIKIFTTLFLVQCFSAGLLTPVNAGIQDDSSTQQDDVNNATTDSLDDLKKQWSDLDFKLKAKEQEFQAATTNEERTQISGEFALLTEQADLLIDKIEKSALVNLASNRGDEESLKLLVGILINHAAFEKKDRAIELGISLLELGTDIKYFKAAAMAPRVTYVSRPVLNELVTRAEEAKADDLPRVKLETEQGDIILELFENEAPNTVANFITLVEKGFYNDLNFHRVIEGFMAQGGRPEGDANGGPGYFIPCECYDNPNVRRHYKYSLSMAHGGRDTGGSQFYIAFNSASTDHLDFMHTVFGRLIEGEEVLEKIARTEDKNKNAIPGAVPTKIINAEVIRKRDHQYTVKKVGDKQGTPPVQPPLGSVDKQDNDQSEQGNEKASDDGKP